MTSPGQQKSKVLEESTVVRPTPDIISRHSASLDSPVVWRHHIVRLEATRAVAQPRSIPRLETTDPQDDGGLQRGQGQVLLTKEMVENRRSHKRSPNYLYQLCLSGGRGDSLGPGQTQLPSLNGKEILEGWAHLTRTPFSLAICFDRARKKATRAPLVEP